MRETKQVYVCYFATLLLSANVTESAHYLNIWIPMPEASLRRFARNPQRDFTAGYLHGRSQSIKRWSGITLARYPKQGYAVWADSLVLLQDAPNRANAIKFMDFMLAPENVAALTNFVRYSASVKGVSELLDPALASLPEGNPPADAPAVPASRRWTFQHLAQSLLATCQKLETYHLKEPDGKYGSIILLPEVGLGPYLILVEK